MENYYQILGVPPNASQEQIKEHFRFLAQAYHPDKFATSAHKKHAEAAFKKINDAYQVLSNPVRRDEYDRRQSSFDSRYEEERRRGEEAEAAQRRAEEERRKTEEAEAAQRRAKAEQQRREQAEAAQRQAEYERQHKAQAERAEAERCKQAEAEDARRLEGKKTVLYMVITFCSLPFLYLAYIVVDVTIKSTIRDDSATAIILTIIVIIVMANIARFVWKS